MHGAHEDPGLAEVKAVLIKLQRIDPAAEGSPAKSIPGERGPSVQQAPLGAQAQAAIELFDRKHAALNQATSSTRRIGAYLYGAGALIAGAAVLLAAGIIHLPSDLKITMRKAEPALLAQDKKNEENEAALLAGARRFLSDGDVTIARSYLLRAEPERRAEVAFMLAQSYDPNYLKSLPKANGLPDRFEAERWYKKWHELAVQSGLEMDSGRLQRIINAMR